jgi:hypothetical protein
VVLRQAINDHKAHARPVVLPISLIAVDWIFAKNLSIADLLGKSQFGEGFSRPVFNLAAREYAARCCAIIESCQPRKLGGKTTRNLARNAADFKVSLPICQLNYAD